jgi:hypothetical protein
MCSLNLTGTENTSVNPDTNTMIKDETANQMVTRLKALNNSIRVKIIVKASQNQGEKINL